MLEGRQRDDRVKGSSCNIPQVAEVADDPFDRPYRRVTDTRVDVPVMVSQLVGHGSHRAIDALQAWLPVGQQESTQMPRVTGLLEMS